MSESGSVRSLGSKTLIIRSAFAKICAEPMFQRQLFNKWLPADTWVEAALTKSNLIDHTLMSTIKVGTFNSAMGRNRGDFDGQMMSRYDGTNTTGIFRLTFQRVMFYMVTDKNKQVPYPPLDDSWKKEVLTVAKNVFNMPKTRSLFSSQANSTMPQDDIPADQQAPKKRHKTGNNGGTTAHIALPPLLSNPVQQLLTTAADNCTVGGDETTTPSTISAASSPPRTNNTRQALNSLSYWNSQDACNLFGFELLSPLDDVRDMLKVRIELLQSVSRSENGWRNVIEGCDPDNLCSPSDIFAVRGRSIILCLAYQLAILHMNKKTWKECCSDACSQLNLLGVEQATQNRAVRDWNCIFRANGTFPHPNHAVRCGKQPLPLLFQNYPSAMDDIIQFGVKNLTTLTVESLHGFCHKVLIPKLFCQWQEDIQQSECLIRDRDPMATKEIECLIRDRDPMATKEMFLLKNRISTLSIPTCWRWLHRLGFTYNTQRKGYYVDGHERDDVVASRKAFCETYLTEIEPLCLRWIQVSQHELETTHNILNPEFGYRFVDANGNAHVEFHVDYCSRYINADNVLLQERGLFPKSLGEGLMISAFVSRDSGFGMPISDEQLVEINSFRQGTEYKDKVAATQVLSTAAKQPLTESPFVRSLLIGATKGGYWNSFHMAVQLEDVVDCLKILRPDFDFVFLFDHSQGHARRKDCALDASSMSRSFGGVQPKMRSSKIVEGCFGPFNRTLSIGDVQTMVFEDGDNGPWWILSEEGREARRHDIHAPADEVNTAKLTNRTKLQLANALREEAGITVDPLCPMNEIKEFAIRHGVDLQYRKIHVTEGWLGNPKGLLQILWERGWIDPCECTASKQDKIAGMIAITSFYTVNGRKDPQTGQLLESSSLRALMDQCTDFKEEETALQFLGKQLGLRVLFTPKFHCEFAGEGIEYNWWAHAKAKMRTTPIREKKGRANFIALVMKCICPATVLTKERIRKFSARARAYICTYYHLSRDNAGFQAEGHQGTGDPTAIFNIAEKQHLLYKEIERLMKKFKTHCCALDFDHGFVKGELIEIE